MCPLSRRGLKKEYFEEVFKVDFIHTTRRMSSLKRDENTDSIIPVHFWDTFPMFQMQSVKPDRKQEQIMFLERKNWLLPAFQEVITENALHVRESFRTDKLTFKGGIPT